MVVTSVLSTPIENNRNSKHWRAAGTCNRRGTNSQSTFNGEVAIHHPGLKGLDKPFVRVFPKLVVCLHCSFAEFIVPEKELSVQVQGDAADAAQVVAR
jgi:hypothetical protein